MIYSVATILKNLYIVFLMSMSRHFRDDSGQRPSDTIFHSCTKLFQDQGMPLIGFADCRPAGIVCLISCMLGKNEAFTNYDFMALLFAMNPWWGFWTIQGRILFEARNRSSVDIVDEVFMEKPEYIVVRSLQLGHCLVWPG